MSTLSEQLLSLALTPVWQPSVEPDNTSLLAKLNTAEQALLREKIICFIFTPKPDEPEIPDPEQPVPDTPDRPAPEDDEQIEPVKLAG